MIKEEIHKDFSLMRESQILKLIPVSKSTFRRWIKDGSFPPGFKISGRISVWYGYVVFEWIKFAHLRPELE